MGMCWTIAKLEVATSWKSLWNILQPPWQDLSRLWWTLLALHKGISRLSWWEFSKLSPRKQQPQTIPLFLSINEFFTFFFSIKHHVAGSRTQYFSTVYAVYSKLLLCWFCKLRYVALSQQKNLQRHHRTALQRWSWSSHLVIKVRSFCSSRGRLHQWKHSVCTVHHASAANAAGNCVSSPAEKGGFRLWWLWANGLFILSWSLLQGRKAT